MGHICLSEVQLWRVPSRFAQRVDKELCCKCRANCASQGIFCRFELSVLCILGELWQLSTTPHDVCNCLNLLQKDAEASLPPLVQGDPLILQMDDMVLPVTWKFKYRYDIF